MYPVTMSLILKRYRDSARVVQRTDLSIALFWVTRPCCSVPPNTNTTNPYQEFKTSMQLSGGSTYEFLAPA